MICPYMILDYDENYDKDVELYFYLTELGTPLKIPCNWINKEYLRLFIFCQINHKVYDCIKCFNKEEHKNCPTYKMQVFSAQCRKIEEEAIKDGK